MASMDFMVWRRPDSVYLEQGMKKLALCSVGETQHVRDRLELWV